MSDSERIVALATVPGRAAIGIVRLSGPGSRETLAALTRQDCAEPRRMVLRTVQDPASGRPIDQVMAWWAPGPDTYTGEETAELQGHGNPVLLDAIVDACCRLGARPAEPGEFTRRALLRGRIDLLGAEAILAITEARSAEGAALAAPALTGALRRRLDRMRETLVTAAATVEAAVDDPDDAGADADIAQVVGTLRSLEGEIGTIGGDVDAAGRLLWGTDVAILGPTNAGKSTLFNRLLGEDRAIVDEQPGTTRDVVSGSCELDGLRVRFHDTAGFRLGGGAIEDEGMRRARALRARVDVVLYVVDAVDGDGSSGAEPGDVLVYNKIDRPTEACVPPEGSFAISARTGQGVELLREALARQLGRGSREPALLWTRRQAEASRAAARSCGRAGEALANGEYGPAVVEIGDALRRLGELIGIDPTEAVLDELFARFCVGK